MRQRRLTQEMLADIAGISQGAVSKALRGEGFGKRTSYLLHRKTGGELVMFLFPDGPPADLHD